MISKILQRQEIRFLFVGGLNTLVGYGIYALLLCFHINYLIANTISTLIGIGHSYLWNRFFTFKSKEKASKELLKFVSVYVVSYILGTISLFIFKSILNISPYIAGLLNLIITTLISYFGHKNFSFKKETKDGKLDSKKYLKYFIPILLFVLTFTLMLMFKNFPDFTDEGDVMLAATILSKGKLIYVDFASQHLPFTYFIFTPFALMGASTVLDFRLAMYFLLALIWVLIFIRYKKYFNQWVLFLFPFAYILMMSIPPFTSATVISEHFQAQFLIILFLEVLHFASQKKLDWQSKILIPLCIVLAIGCAFVSILPCFIIVLTFLYIDIKEEWQKKNLTFSKYIGHFWKEYKLIVLIGFGLIFLFLMYLIATGSLIDCYEQAFRLNTTVYSKYNNYSSNPLKTILLIIPKFLMTIKNYLSINSVNFIFASLWLGVILFSLKMAKKDLALGLFIFLIILLCGNRGFQGMHALPYYAISSLSILLLISQERKEIVLGCFILFSLFFFKMTNPYLSNILKEKETNQNYYDMINLIIPEEEMFRIDVSTPEYINTKKIPGSKFNGMVPWFAEIYEQDLLHDIKMKNPQALFYHPYNEVWGYLFKDFVPNINSYILENYLYIKQYNIWIRKDSVKNMEQKLQLDIAEYNNQIQPETIINIKNNIIKQTIIPEENVKAIGLKFGTYNRKNYSVLNFELLNDNTVLQKWSVQANELKDNEIFILNLENNLIKNKEYILKITSDYTNETDYVAIYKMQDEFKLDKNYLNVNGFDSEEDLVMEMYYEEKND